MGATTSTPKRMERRTYSCWESDYFGTIIKVPFGLRRKDVKELIKNGEEVKLFVQHFFDDGLGGSTYYTEVYRADVFLEEDRLAFRTQKDKVMFLDNFIKDVDIGELVPTY